MGRKPKYDYTDRFLLLEIEGYARDGDTNEAIAQRLGLNRTHFINIQKQYPDIYDAIARGRRPLNVIAENSLYKRMTGMKVKTTVTRYLLDKDGNKTGVRDVQETEQEIPPDFHAIEFWLRNRKPATYNIERQKIDATTNGKDINSNIVIEIINSVDKVKKDDSGS